MYNNKNNTSVKERTTEPACKERAYNGNIEELFTFDAVNEETVSTKAYHAPVVENFTATREEVKENTRESEDFMPTSTTMQFESSADSDVYEDLRVKNTSEQKKQKKTEKAYKFNTKAKLLVAVYALVVVTILSLIVINSNMLKNLDNSIDNYSSQVTELTQEYNMVQQELEIAKSDETIIEKALEMGMEKA
ncbi:MAG: hypothetical protein IJW64_02385 [Clostridia bacterium]|nr:hypothetical protein [Clostridia bacterium]